MRDREVVRLVWDHSGQGEGQDSILWQLLPWSHEGYQTKTLTKSTKRGSL